MTRFGSIVGCQACTSTKLIPVVSLGYMPPVNALRDMTKPQDCETWYPAELFFCDECKLVQIGYAPPPEEIFPKSYPYTSRSTRVLRDNFAQLASEVMGMISLKADDLIIDIGSNDGTLLSNFKSTPARVLGIEPTQAGIYARENGIPTVERYFNSKTATEVAKEMGTKARLVLATNVFAHIHDLNDVMAGINHLLDREGIFVTESHYFGDLLRDLQYDTIYHEHLRYYSLTSMKNLLSRHGFEVFQVVPIPTHGGSIRVYASKDPNLYPPLPAVEQLLIAEKEQGLTSIKWISDFRERICNSKLDLIALLGDIRRKGGSVFGIGAPSRGSTLVNYVGIDEALLSSVVEISSSKKLNHYLPGTKIPILDEEKLFREQPSHALFLSWHIADELMPILRRKGFKGDFIIPLPEPRIVTGDAV